ncbi:MAG: hydrogenase maturation protease [Magnetococcales bacterium]|nr:hydrogenase maturation protease [Magnetococcales bacterium]
MNANILILGIGNPLLTDDGIGLLAISHLREKLSSLPNIVPVDVGIPSFQHLDAITRTDHLIVVDAALFNAPPGTIRVLTGAAMDHILHSGKRSAHEVGMGDLLDMARLLGKHPQKRALVCIQIGDLAWGDAPTPEVVAALPQAAQTVWSLAKAWSAGGLSPAMKESTHGQTSNSGERL